MQHVVYGLFGQTQEASATLRDVAEEPSCHGRYHVVTDADTLCERELKMHEMNARSGSIKGLVIGGLGGAVLASLVAGPLGVASAALRGGVMGGALGAMQGVLAGSAGADPRLEKLAKELKKGWVLLTLDTDELSCERDVEEIFRQHGATECHRHHLM